MEFRVLKYFLAVAEVGSITGAADVLHITQPTLSRQLAQLESDLGVDLFDRSSRKIQLTEEGVLLRRRAEQIVELVEKTCVEMRERNEQIIGHLSIGCGELETVEMLADLLSSFAKEYPLVTYSLHTAHADEITERIDRGELSVGLLLEPANIAKFDYVRLPSCERWCVCMLPDSPLAQKPCITAADLVHVPLILPDRPAVANELANWFGEYYKRILTPIMVDLLTTAILLVRRGLGYAITLNTLGPVLDSSKIATRPLEPPLYSTAVLAWNKQRPYSLVTRKFIEFARDFFRSSDAEK